MNTGFWGDLKQPFFVLAPLANVTDAAFRYIIAKYSKFGGADIGEYGTFTRPSDIRQMGGPDVMYTEFVSADGLFKGGYDKLIHDLRFTEAERPIVAQFFSKDPQLMARAAKLAEKLGFDGVDINMGCPDRAVVKQGAGAAMIQNPKRARDIIRATIEATSLPVSVKTRIGFNTIETEAWVPELLEEHPAVLTLHARTKKEMSKFPAHWDEVANAVAIRDHMKSKTLIVGNGDVVDLDDARRKATETGADGIMLGRAIFGNPWLFAERSTEHQINTHTLTIEERLQVLCEHAHLFEKLLVGVKSFALMKKHFKSYVKGFPNTKDIVAALMTAESAWDVQRIVEQFLEKRISS